jgi:repressor of nif and glnA expression
MSRRDLVHVLNALADAARAEAGVGVPAGVIDEAVGRSPGDLRTLLNLQSLEADGLVREAGAGGWALTEAGVQHLRDEQELSDR